MKTARPKQTTKTRMLRAIALRKSSVVLRQDVEKFGSPSQVTRVLQELTRNGTLIKVGYGVYVRAAKLDDAKEQYKNSWVDFIAPEVFERLEIQFEMGKAIRDYNSGKTDQVPMKFVLDTGPRRITRKLEIDGSRLFYERDIARAVRARVEADKAGLEALLREISTSGNRERSSSQ